MRLTCTIATHMGGTWAGYLMTKFKGREDLIMRIGQGANSYRWNDRWAKLPTTESGRNGWAHHGVAVTGSGEVITCHPGVPTMMLLDQEGSVK